MYYYAYINDSKICQDTYGFPSQVSLPEYIYLGTVDDKSVVGKKWTGSEWVEVYERIHDLAEGGSDDNTDCHVDNIATTDKGLKVFDKLLHG